MPSPQPPSAEIPGYILHEQIGEGGMGVVHRARDLQFDRDVAIKLLSPGAAASAYAAARFRIEARISGQLQHPGIPAVHELGDLPDGKPFLAMKLVRGQTLQALLDLRESPGADHGQFLAIFEQVCHAVGYAHAHRVIHRDLKPSNIMVGKFGEVQVMDWGLAKVLGESPATPAARHEDNVEFTIPPEADVESTIDLHRRVIDTPHGGDSATRTGDILGTVAYMPPEQAGGEIRLLDARSDVFALGAILCQILTGRPPYTGDDFNAVRIKAISGNLRDAFDRLDQCPAEIEWVALCKKCLAAEKEARPADGQAVAQEASELRADAENRAKQAEVDRKAALIQKSEERERRRQLLAAGSALIGVLLLGIAGTTIGLIRANAAAKKEERAKLQAEAMATVALDANQELVFGIQDTLEENPGTHELSKSLLSAARKGLEKLRLQVRQEGIKPDRMIVWANVRIGDVERRLGNSDAAKEAFETALHLAERLFKADPRKVGVRRDVAVCCGKLGGILMLQGDLSRALALHEKALQLNEGLLAQHPENTETRRDVGISYLRVGDTLQQLGRQPEALEYFKKSLAMDQAVAEAAPDDRDALRDLSISYERLGDVSLESGDQNAAREYFEKKLHLDERLVELDPSDRQSRTALSISCDRLGGMAQKAGRMKEAADYFQKSLDISQQLADDNPKDVPLQRDLSVAFEQLGNLHLASKDFSAGHDFHTKALAIRERIYAEDKSNARAAIDLVVNYNNLGNMEKGQRQYEAAAGWFAKSHDILQTLQKENRLAEQDAFWLAYVELERSVCEKAPNAHDLEFVYAQPPEEIPDLALIGVRRLIAEKNAEKAIESANRFAKWVDSLPALREQQHYNAAYAFALCAQSDSVRDVAVEKALVHLELARTGGYFTPRVVEQFKNDADFEVIRGSPKFATFAKRLEEP